MKAVAEHDHFTGETRWHIPKGPPDAAVTFQPIFCGGGITSPGEPQDMPAKQICPDCRGLRRLASR